MCTRFVYHGNDMITGFNFDIDLSAWKHKVIMDEERFILESYVRMEPIILIMGLIKMGMSVRWLLRARQSWRGIPGRTGLHDNCRFDGRIY